jgi:DNA repair exonuclease SbcCD ATPase subunit
MYGTTSIASLITIFAITVSHNGVVFSQQPSFEQLRQEIKPAADILLDWNNAQNESIDETKKQIVANQERIEREQRNRVAEAQRAIDLAKALDEDNARQAEQSNAEKFDLHLRQAMLNLRDPQLRRDAEVIQGELGRLQNSRSSASHIKETLRNLQDRLNDIQTRQKELDNVQTFRNELESVRRTLTINQLVREAQGIDAELRKLSSRTPAEQIQDSLRVQRNSLRDIQTRQRDADNQAATIARQKEHERQMREAQEAAKRRAEQEYWNSPAGRAEKERRAREAAAAKARQQENMRQIINGISRNIRF